MDVRSRQLQLPVAYLALLCMAQQGRPKLRLGGIAEVSGESRETCIIEGTASLDAMPMMSELRDAARGPG